jgi:hypothetical protein
MKPKELFSGANERLGATTPYAFWGLIVRLLNVAASAAPTKSIRGPSATCWLLLLVLLLLVGPFLACGQPIRGRLANPGFVNQRIRAAYFFSGQALDGSNPYSASPTPPACNAPSCCSTPDGCNQVNCPNRSYTLLHPVDQAHLEWSDNTTNQQFALNTMVQAGINVIHMSSWGDDTGASDAWVVRAAPMQTSPQSHEELFTAADPQAGRPLLIVPFLEERDSNPLPWVFKDEFPTRVDGSNAPGTISQVEYFIRHYLQNPAHPEWSNRWAQIYDKDGQPRFAVGIIHAASNRLGDGGDAAFAAGFDTIANQISNDTRVRVGFLLDALPFGTHAQASFFPSPNGTGPYLAATASVLGIACFVPEVYVAPTNDATLLSWKRQWSQGWAASGVPFLMDVSSGYNGSVVFCETWSFGEGSAWLSGMDELAHEFGQTGIVFNSWNGYTEGMVAVPTAEQGGLFYNWLTALRVADVYAQAPAGPAPRNGTWGSPYTLSEAVQNVSAGRTIGLLPTTTTPFTISTISKACSLIAVGGPATIGN